MKDELINARKYLDNDNIPGYSEDCDFCQYQQSVIEIGRKKGVNQMSRYLTCKELLILEMQEKRDGKTVLRVVQWGNNKPKLEKRRFYLQDGELKTGKLEGLSSEDLKLIMKKHDEIQALLIGNKQSAE